jgi:hypothetical protein
MFKAPRQSPKENAFDPPSINCRPRMQVVDIGYDMTKPNVRPGVILGLRRGDYAVGYGEDIAGLLLSIF